MVNKKLINGLKYEKLSEEQLYDLSSWELVDIILAYRKDYKAKEQELEQYKRSKQASYEAIQTKCNELELKNRRLKQTLDEIKEIANKFDFWNSNLSQASEILHEIIEKTARWKH